MAALNSPERSMGFFSDRRGNTLPFPTQKEIEDFKTLSSTDDFEFVDIHEKPTSVDLTPTKISPVLRDIFIETADSFQTLAEARQKVQDIKEILDIIQRKHVEKAAESLEESIEKRTRAKQETGSAEELADAEQDVSRAKQELAEAEKEFETTTQKLEDAEQELAAAEQELAAAEKTASESITTAITHATSPVEDKDISEERLALIQNSVKLKISDRGRQQLKNTKKTNEQLLELTKELLPLIIPQMDSPELPSKHAVVLASCHGTIINRSFKVKDDLTFIAAVECGVTNFALNGTSNIFQYVYDIASKKGIDTLNISMQNIGKFLNQETLTDSKSKNEEHETFLSNKAWSRYAIPPGAELMDYSFSYDDVSAHLQPDGTWTDGIKVLGETMGKLEELKNVVDGYDKIFYLSELLAILHHLGYTSYTIVSQTCAAIQEKNPEKFQAIQEKSRALLVEHLQEEDPNVTVALKDFFSKYKESKSKSKSALPGQAAAEGGTRRKRHTKRKRKTRKTKTRKRTRKPFGKTRK